MGYFKLKGNKKQSNLANKLTLNVFFWLLVKEIGSKNSNIRF
jgi:hypothetical protein